MGVRLREVAEQGAGRGIHVFREEPERVGQRGDALEDAHGLVEAAREGERFGSPERADRERARGVAEVVFVDVAEHQAAADEALLVGVEGAEEARIAAVEEAERGQQEDRSVRVLAVERLRDLASNPE